MELLEHQILVQVAVVVVPSLEKEKAATVLTAL
jgi:uncharacterized membrane protein YgcG